MLPTLFLTTFLLAKTVFISPGSPCFIRFSLYVLRLLHVHIKALDFFYRTTTESIR